MENDSFNNGPPLPRLLRKILQLSRGHFSIRFIRQRGQRLALRIGFASGRSQKRGDTTRASIADMGDGSLHIQRLIDNLGPIVSHEVTVRAIWFEGNSIQMALNHPLRLI